MIALRRPTTSAALVVAVLFAALAVAVFGVSSVDARPEPRGQFFAVDQLWSFHVEVELPFRDANGDGRNDYRPQFNLNAVRTGGPAPGSDDWCPATLDVRPQVGASGDERLAVFSASPLDRACQFQTSFPQSIESGVPGITFTRSAGAIAHVNHRSNPTARITYTDGRTTFAPDLSVSGFEPRDEGTIIRLRFERETGERGRAACALHDSDRFVEWRVNAQGHAVRQRDATFIATLPPHAPDYGHVCHYAASWPSVPEFASPERRTMLLAEGSGHVTGTYRRVASAEATTFTPLVDLQVPFTDYDDDGAHDYRGARLAVTFVRRRGQSSGCSGGGSGDTHEYEVRSAVGATGRSVVTPAVPFTLVDTPPRSLHRCVYDVRFDPFQVPQPGGRRLQRLSEGHSVVAATSPAAASAEYENSQVSRAVVLQIVAPAEANGQTFTATVDPSGADAIDDRCTAAQTVALTVDAAGAASQQVELVDFKRAHVSLLDRCSYVVRWAEDEDGPGTMFAQARRHNTSITASSFGAAGDPASEVLASTRYGQSTPFTFVGRLSVRTVVPVTSSTAFAASFTASDSGCSQIPDQLLFVEAGGTSAEVTLAGLTVRPLAGSVDCVYEVTWDQQVVGVRGWELSPSDVATRFTPRRHAGAVFYSAQPVNATYYPVFNSNVEVSTTLPVTQRTTFDVPVRATGDDCSSPSPVQVTIEEGDTTGGAFLERLVAQTTSGGVPCVYEMQWPPSETGVAPLLWTGDRSYDGVSSVTLDSRDAHQRYLSVADSTFEVSVSVLVPPVDAAGTDVSLFAGTQFTLAFARAPQSHELCSAGTPHSFVYTVQDDGSVTGDHPSHLVHIPARHSEPCVYLVSTTEASSPPGSTTHWALHVESITAHIQQSSSRVAVEYRVADVTFTPDVQITPPDIVDPFGIDGNVFARVWHATDDTSGPVTFDVTFDAAADAPAGCDAPASSTTFSVASYGGVTGSAPLLPAYALTDADVDGRLTQTAEPCTYRTSFPSTSSTPRGWLARAASPPPDTTFSPDDPQVSVAYETGDVTLPVDLVIENPVYLAPPARVGSVTLTAEPEQHAACLVDDGDGAPSSTKTRRFDFDESGQTTLDGAFSVVGYPPAASAFDDACGYLVDWSATDLPASSAAWSADLGVNGLTTAGLGRPRLVEVYATPTPRTFEATLTLQTDSSVARTGAQFTVTVSPSAESPSGCTSASTERFYADGGTRTITLAHSIATSVVPCTYDVRWPDDEDGHGTSFTPDPSFVADVTLSAASSRAQSRYINPTADEFMDVAVLLDTSEVVWRDTTFTVTISPPDTPANCSAEQQVAVSVQRRTSQAAQLLSVLRRPAGATEECVYTISWPTLSEDMTWTQNVDVVPSAELSNDESVGSNSYVTNTTRFTPNVAFDVSFLDFDGDLRHDYAGAHFSVLFGSLRFSAGQQDRCPIETTKAYVLRDDGDVEPVVPFTLVDEHGSGRCVYQVVFPAQSTDTLFPLIRTTSATDSYEVSALTNGARATYRELVERFDATLYLGGVHQIDNANEDPVNPIPAGTPFTVRVSPASGVASGCDANPGDPGERTAEVTLLKSEVLERLPSTRLTRHEMRGLLSVTAEGLPCRYEVAWPESEDGGDYFRVAADAAYPFDAELRPGNVDDVGAVVWYELNPAGAARTTFFDATLSVDVDRAAADDRSFVATIEAPRQPSGCSTTHDVRVALSAASTSATSAVDRLVRRPFAASVDCVYGLRWGDTDEPTVSAGGSSSTTYQAGGSLPATLDAATRDATGSYRHHPATQTPAPPPPQTGGTTGGGQTGGTQTGGTQTGGTQTGSPPATNPPPTGNTNTGNPGVSSTGGTHRSAGSTSRGTTGGSASRSSGGATTVAPARWQTARTVLPVRATLSTPDQPTPPNAFVELLLSAPSHCGDDIDMFGGLPANVGLVFAVALTPGTQTNVLTGAGLRMPSHEARGDETRDCVLRLTLVTAPNRCNLNVARRDDDGRAYVTLDGGVNADAFTSDVTLACDPPPPPPLPPVVESEPQPEPQPPAAEPEPPARQPSEAATPDAPTPTKAPATTTAADEEDIRETLDRIFGQHRSGATRA